MNRFGGKVTIKADDLDDIEERIDQLLVALKDIERSLTILRARANDLMLLAKFINGGADV